MTIRRLHIQIYERIHSNSTNTLPRFLHSCSSDLGTRLTPSHKTSSPTVYYNCQITKNGRTGKIKEAESVFNRMPRKNVVSWTAMLTAYAENGQIEKARDLFDEMPERSVASWNAMITAYTRNRLTVEKAVELFGSMPERNAVTYAAMIGGFVNAGKFVMAEELFAEMPAKWRDPFCSNVLMNGFLKTGRLEEAVRIFYGMAEKNVVSYSSMVDGYCRNGRIDEARRLFDGMTERNVVTWTAIINGYLKQDLFQDGFGLFMLMRKESVEVVPNTLTTLFEGCGRLGRRTEGCQTHGLVFHGGFEYDVFLCNSIITMYCRLGCVDAAYNVFGVMHRKDVVSWNSLIAAYVQAERVEEAYRLFLEAPDKDVVSWTTIITGFSRIGLTWKSSELFNIMPTKDDVAWTALIAGYVGNEEFEEAIRWFNQMLQNAIEPNPLTISSVLSASACMATLQQGQQIHARALKMHMEVDLSIQNSLVSMYSKCGGVNDAYTIFKSITTPNLISFNSMITGFAQNGFGSAALKLFEEMKEKDLQPNEITFLSVLSACTHVGLVEEGRKYFKTMRSSHQTEPGPDHYTCMVSLLSRAGLLDEAVDLINSMPFEPHSAVWGALLGASRTHSRIDLAKLAARRISELEPNNAAPYVVLSELYSTLGKKDEEEDIRIAKRMRGIRKSPGCSWITVKDRVAIFLSGDRSHAAFSGIESVLLTIFVEIEQLSSFGNLVCMPSPENHAF